MYKCYPHAKRAHLKDGGNFPYLSRVGDVVLYVEIHLRNFFVTRFCPVDSSKLDPEELRLMRGELPKPEE
jgi:maspardin